MRVRVNFYGVLREDLGTSRAEFELDGEHPTIADLVARLTDDHPGLESRLASTAFAVENRVVDRTSTLYDGAVVDLLPPVSGG